jgi:hypothetical protein
MELGEKEKQVVLVALRRYLQELKNQINSEETDEDERTDLVNDATLVDILISRFAEEV